MAHSVVWCDIPVMDLDRAIRFYSAVLGSKIKKETFPNGSIGLLPFGEGEVGACLYLPEDNAPSDRGPQVYLSVQGRLEDAVAAVEENGGRIIHPRHAIGPYGFRAVVQDSEGNRIALHST
jgi:uncharacterized protein